MARKTSTAVAETEKPRPYHQTSAELQALHLKDRVAVKLALAIDARGFTQRQAAAYLGVSQPRVSDLMRGNTHLFSLDTLIEWMFALDQPVSISFDAPEWGRSSPQPMSPQDWGDQVAFYTRVIKNNPHSTIALHRRAHAYTRLEHYDEAIQDYTACIEIAPDNMSGWYNRASVYALAGRHETCISDCNALLERFPDEAGIYSIRAGAYGAQKKYARALADYKRAIRHDPMRPGPFMNRARLHLEMNQPQLALADYEHAHAVDPTDAFVRRHIRELKKQLAGEA